MIEYKLFLGYLAIIITFASYIPYFRNIFIGKTKPHVFSWLVWTFISGIAFAAQIVEGGGAGAWATGATTLICITIFLLAIFKGRRTFDAFDWFAFSLALLGILLWRITNQPLLAIVLVTIADAISSLLTFRKGFYKPYEETMSTFALNSFKWVIAIFALQVFTVSTWLYPASLVLTNGSIALMILIRRKQLKK